MALGLVFYDLALMQKASTKRLALPTSIAPKKTALTVILRHYVIKRPFAKNLQIVDFYFYVFMKAIYKAQIISGLGLK